MAVASGLERVATVKGRLLSLQSQICSALELADGDARFGARELAGERGGEARPRVLEGGRHLERATVNLSHAAGRGLPATLAERRPELHGASLDAVSVSVIVHPANPYAPSSHANLRFFSAYGEGGEAWWFGGGADLTPIYGFVEDAVHWHRALCEACRPFGEEVYPAFKAACDRYYYLPHRGEARGVGGVFFDRLDEGGFERCFALVAAIGEAWLEAYLPILERRKEKPFGERERDFQLYRRGRYVEFNLLFDRGTRYGIEAGVRSESVLASLPPLAAWRYDWQPEAGSEEERLIEEFLQPRDWVALS